MQRAPRESESWNRKKNCKKLRCVKGVMCTGTFCEQWTHYGQLVSPHKDAAAVMVFEEIIITGKGLKKSLWVSLTIFSDEDKFAARRLGRPSVERVPSFGWRVRTCLKAPQSDSVTCQIITAFTFFSVFWLHNAHMQYYNQLHAQHIFCQIKYFKKCTVKKKIWNR